jgi:signal transduction histidine kinase/DNA-binding response OmpR family regulator
MIAKQGDEALQITDSLIQILNKEGQYNSNLGFKVRLVYCKALYDSSEEVDALELLWKLKEESKSYEEWNVFATICIEIAKMEEMVDDWNSSYQSLEEARQVIKKYYLDSLLSAYYLRYASTKFRHLQKEGKDFYTAFPFAEKAVKAAQKHKQAFEEAEGWSVMGYISEDMGNLDNDAAKKDSAIVYLDSAIVHYEEAGDISNHLDIFSYKSVLVYNRKGSNQKLLNEINSKDEYLNQYKKDFPSVDLSYAKYYFYILKSKIFKQMGEIDSAVAYTVKWKDVRYESLKKSKVEEIKRGEEKYNYEKKSKELTAEKARTQFFFIIILLSIIFVIILFFYTFKLRHANKLIQEQTEELKAIDKIKSRFFANISHELRTPLTLVTSPINILLKEKKLTEKQDLLLQMAKQGSSNLKNLINEILDLGKIESGKMELQLKATPIAAFFEHNFTQFDSMAIFYEIGYQYLVKIPQDYTALIDREKCRQIIFNLLSNAFKFTPPEGKINTLVWIENDRLFLKVTDDGKGIHPDDLPHIFDRYFQTRQKDSLAMGGTGIGLALCSEYAKLFKGTINVNSQLTTGTSFIVDFPLQRTEILEGDYSNFLAIYNKNTPKDFFESSVAVKEDISIPTLLLVEDNKDLQNYIRLTLESDYRVVTANNGQKACEIMNSGAHSIDLVLSDLMMPVMDGYQLLEKLKNTEATKAIPFIMLTARGGRDDRLEALRIGVDSYLTKPFDEEELKVQIKNLLKNQTIRKQSEKEMIEEEASSTDKPKQLNKLQEEQMQGLEKFVKENISNINLSVSLLVSELAMSESSLLRLTKRNVGLTTKKYITEVRLSHARKLLENGTYDSITRVAIETGYTDVRTFSRAFKKHFGKLPSQIFD